MGTSGHFVERIKRATGNMLMNIAARFTDSVRRPRGYFSGFMTMPDGTRIELDIGKNLIVDTASILMAELISNANVNGLTYMAIGSGGVEDWATTSPKYDQPLVENVNQVSLNRELARVPITFDFLKEDGTLSDDNGTDPTHILQCTGIFPKDAAVDQPINELGMFGRNATEDLNSGRLFNIKFFKTSFKIPGSALTYIYKLVL